MESMKGFEGQTEDVSFDHRKDKEPLGGGVLPALSQEPSLDEQRSGFCGSAKPLERCQAPQSWPPSRSVRLPGQPSTLPGCPLPSSVTVLHPSETRPVPMPYLRASVLRNMLDNKRDTKEEQAEKIRAAFELFEEDGSRTISVRNLPIAMRPLGFRPDRKEVEQLKAELDKEGSGKVHFSDFLALMTKKMAERNVEEEIQKAFPFFDDEDTGTITLKSLKRVASELGEKVSEEELQDMIDHADLNGDGEVDPHELLSVIKKARKV
ncbi:uncharacterized protein LOC100029309 [Monodelphis domestica]|uniref:uncharacterized protein LOC100029309 n=1 Tax=Monodelphis domestica TaxID=13616 RepID=UPI00020F637A|nr:uncharacterized protein LOC100029309 [Monodelphis domestica]